MIELIKEVKVEPHLKEFTEILKKDVEQFNERIERLNTFRIEFVSAVSDKQAREFNGVLDYKKLVKLRNRFMYMTTDVIRLISFRTEAIETAIYT